MQIFRLHPGDATVADEDAVALRRDAKVEAEANAAAAAHAAGGDGIDLGGAIAKHQAWKTTLRNTVMRGEQLDVAKVSCDDACPLGQWLHGNGRRQWGTRPAFTDLLEKHAVFHREVGRVAQSVNAGHKEESLAMLGNDTPFAMATRATVMAIRALRLEGNHAPSAASRPQSAFAAAAPRATRPAAETVTPGADDWETF
jgi:methyl-accepting chemotaxis protein